MSTRKFAIRDIVKFSDDFLTYLQSQKSANAPQAITDIFEKLRSGPHTAVVLRVDHEAILIQFDTPPNCPQLTLGLSVDIADQFLEVTGSLIANDANPPLPRAPITGYDSVPVQVNTAIAIIDRLLRFKEASLPLILFKAERRATEAEKSGMPLENPIADITVGLGGDEQGIYKTCLDVVSAFVTSPVASEPLEEAETFSPPSFLPLPETVNDFMKEVLAQSDSPEEKAKEEYDSVSPRQVLRTYKRLRKSLPNAPDAKLVYLLAEEFSISLRQCEELLNANLVS